MNTDRIEKKILLRAPLERVWQALTDSTEFGTWFGIRFSGPFKAGAKMAFGTDAGVYPHGDNAKQFGKMVEWGMKPIDAIQAATLNAADLIGIGGKAGSIETGYWADIIAVEGNPLENVPALESVKLVMKGGIVARNDFAAN